MSRLLKNKKGPWGIWGIIAKQVTKDCHCPLHKNLDIYFTSKAYLHKAPPMVAYLASGAFEIKAQVWDGQGALLGCYEVLLNTNFLV